MKLAAIICEYNPFHKGHLHQIEQTKKITGCDAVICIMSGNFSQRAESAIMDKYERAKVAIECGADLVVNLPTAYSVNNAEVFSLAAVKIANAFKNVAYLSFGMEKPNLEALNETANFLLNETDDYKKYLKDFLNLGLSFNESRIKSVEKLISENKLQLNHKEEMLNLLMMPNNILAVEYVKALKQLNSHIQPILIKRLGSNYNDTKLKGKLSSATSIRTKIYYTQKVKTVKQALPTPSYNYLKKYITQNGIVNQHLLNKLAMYKFRTTKLTELQKLYNVSEGLENRVKHVASDISDASQLKDKLKTKRYKTSRLNSIILNAVLNINSSTVKHIYKVKKLPYVKVLALNSNNKELLQHLQCQSKLIFRKKDVENLKKTTYVKELMAIENNSNLVYNMLLNKNILNSNDVYTTVLKVKRKSK